MKFWKKETLKLSQPHKSVSVWNELKYSGPMQTKNFMNYENMTKHENQNV